MKRLLLISLVFLLTACSSKFDQSMKLGKQELLNKKYDDAKNQFEIALIEKPSDKDAKLLYDQSKSLSDKSNLDAKYKKYIDQNSSNFETLLNLATIGKGAPTDSNEFDAYLQKLNDLNNKSNTIRLDWLDSPEIMSVHQYFLDAINDKIRQVEASIDVFKILDSDKPDNMLYNYKKQQIDSQAKKFQQDIEKYTGEVKKIRNNMSN